MLTIPVERGGNLRPREPANSKPTHLPQLLREFALDIQPRLTGVGIRVGLGLPPIKFSGERIGDRRGCSRIETIPQLPYEFDPLLGRELVDQNCARCHGLSLIDSPSARNYPVCSPNGLRFSCARNASAASACWAVSGKSQSSR